ncbi:ATP-dependent DNA helicase [Cutibacterium acnes JCM 18916]|nr:ATP-dependent DNA helicase [Cutibacterium acnes JCM 18916]
MARRIDELVDEGRTSYGQVAVFFTVPTPNRGPSRMSLFALACPTVSSAV